MIFMSVKYVPDCTVHSLGSAGQRGGRSDQHRIHFLSDQPISTRRLHTRQKYSLSVFPTEYGEGLSFNAS